MIYTPERGDAVWLDFNPPTGLEPAVRRLAIVVSPSNYNRKVGLAIFCPITNLAKGYPFELAIPKNKKITGVILADQLKSLDWRAQNAEFIVKLSESVVEEVLKKAKVLL